MIASLAWPFVAMNVLWVIRDHLPDIGKAITKVKYKDVEVEFSKAVNAVAIETEVFFPELVTDSEITAQSSTVLPIDKLDQLAKISQRAAIIEAWDRVELVSGKVLRVIPRPWNHPWHFKTTTEEFVDQGVLNKRQAEVYREMQLLKHSVERYEAREINEESVKKYIRSADVMAAYLEAFLTKKQEQSSPT